MELLNAEWSREDVEHWELEPWKCFPVVDGVEEIGVASQYFFGFEPISMLFYFVFDILYIYIY